MSDTETPAEKAHNLMLDIAIPDPEWTMFDVNEKIEDLLGIFAEDMLDSMRLALVNVDLSVDQIDDAVAEVEDYVGNQWF